MKPRQDLRADGWRQSSAATLIAAELADLCFSKRLGDLDEPLRRWFMELAEDAVAEAVEEHALPIEATEPDAMQAWHDLRERLMN